jgi:hypothetical protein
LHERSDKIEWGAGGAAITLEKWTISANRVNGNIVLEVSHTYPQAEVLNAAFTTSSFFTTDDELNYTNCNVIGNRYLVNSNGSTHQLLCQGDRIEYTLQANDQPYFLFKDRHRGVRIYVEL